MSDVKNAPNYYSQGYVSGLRAACLVLNEPQPLSMARQRVEQLIVLAKELSAARIAHEADPSEESSEP
jgi:hypothetical protein